MSLSKSPMSKKIKVAAKQAAGAAKFSEVSKFLKIISDENRLKILLILGNGPMNVTEIHNKLDLPQNLTSHHISKLKSLDLLSEKREGVFRHYSLNNKSLRENVKSLKELMKV